jgi:hypothetical protein
MTSSMELQLNSAISKLEQQLSYNLEQQSALAPDRMLDIKEKLSPAVISDRSKAGQLMAYLEKDFVPAKSPFMGLYVLFF